jgi:uncharacterized integral membrane protein (TIGR00697 family)
MHWAEQRPVRLLVALSGFFLADAMVAEFAGTKVFSLEATLGLADVTWHLLGVSGSLSFTVGVVFWPLVFVLTDIINEYYGSKGVRLVSWLTAAFIAWSFVAAYVAIELAPSAFWSHSGQSSGVPDMQSAYSQIFGQGMWLIAGSLLSFLTGQWVDVQVFRRIRRLTGERRIWLRATGSTAVSQLFDTFLVLYIAFVLGPQHWPMQQFLAVAMVNYAYKLLVALLAIPLLYGVHDAVERYLGPADSRRLRAAASG